VPIPRFLADELAEHLVGKNPAASLAVQAGANVKLVQQMLGHASAAMTLDVYAGLFADNLDEVADRLDQAFTNLNADQMRTEPGPRPGTPHPMR
jgi:site-specific recombinase XerC